VVVVWLLLQIMDARNVLVVVTRWYGGIHLGSSSSSSSSSGSSSSSVVVVADNGRPQRAGSSNALVRWNPPG